VDQSGDGVVLLFGSGQQQYREYLIAGASGYRPLWLIDAVPATWQRPYLRGSSTVPMLDPARTEHDEPGLGRAAAAVAGTRPVLGCVTWDEGLVLATARIAQRLGLPGASADGADACRNKHRTRQALTAAGLPQPRFALVHTVAQALAAAQDIGYPVVLKPRGMGASIGVVRADSVGDVPAAFAVAEHGGRGGPAAYERGLLVEELVAGPEISVDGAVTAGAYQPFFLARKELGPAPYFEEVAHLVDGADPLLADEALLRVLAGAHRALGLRDVITHTEVRFGPAGPVVIEVNARLGGDLIPYLGQLATGIDPGRVAVEVATGVPPALVPARRRCAGIRFAYPPRDCRVRAVTVPAPGTVPGLAAARAMVAPGDPVLLPPRAHIGRYAYVICTAEHPGPCRTRLDLAAARVALDHEPLGLTLADERT